MSPLPPHLFRRWSHSFEEDTGDVHVYRPAEYPFPPARGRGGLELALDGTFVEWAVGRGDARQPVAGRWQEEAPGRVRVSFDADARPAFDLEIVAAAPDVLKVRRSAAAG
jgi:hypothetical protein